VFLAWFPFTLWHFGQKNMNSVNLSELREKARLGDRKAQQLLKLDNTKKGEEPPKTILLVQGGTNV
jgi:hypothetical protein